MEKQNQRIKKLGEPRKQLSGMTKKKEKEKTGELGNLISEVVKFSVKICIGEMAETRPGGFSLALYSLLRIDTSFFGCDLLYVPYVPYGV
jgi:hypothetical protein